MENHGIPWNGLEIYGIPQGSLEFHGGGASAGRARSLLVGRPGWEGSGGAAQGSQRRRKFIKSKKILLYLPTPPENATNFRSPRNRPRPFSRVRALTVLRRCVLSNPMIEWIKCSSLLTEGLKGYICPRRAPLPI